ncbi:MAG: sulfotransferase [Marmoricola sp.]
MRVLYIGGVGRSGTTLLDRMLGQLPGFFSAGEVEHLWSRGLGGERCGCGESFMQCGVWAEVGQRAFGGWDTVDVERVRRLQRSVDNTRSIPGLLLPLWPPHRRRLAEFRDLLGRLYAAISEVSGGSIIVDSSKHPAYAFLLRGVPGIDLRVVHMVRDSRGVAHSWTKVVQRPEVIGRVEYMPRYAPMHTAIWWMLYNALFRLLARLGTPSLVVPYERLVEQPQAQLSTILQFCGDARGLEALGSLISGRTVQMHPTHSVAGNPLRFRQGQLDIRLDEAWRNDMRRLDRIMVTAISWPLLRRLAYRPRGGTPR